MQERTNLQTELPDELAMLQDMVRRFVDEELIPLEGKTLIEGQQKLKPDIEEVGSPGTELEFAL